MSFSQIPRSRPDSLTTAKRQFPLRGWSRFLLVVLLSFAIVGISGAATTKSSTSASRSTAKKAPAKKTTKASTQRKTTRPRARRSTRRRPTRTARQRGQQQPTTERFKEIQQALLDAGHLEGEPSGKWDDATIEAMKRFQEAHSIQPSGKINAISLIALGLGPKRGPAPGTDSVLSTAEAGDGSRVDR